MGILDFFKKKQNKGENTMEVNVRKCAYQNCVENVPQWAMYCQPHLEHIRKLEQPQLPPTIPNQPQSARQMPQTPYPPQTQPLQPQSQPQMQYPQQPRPITRQPELQPMTPIQIEQQQQDYQQEVVDEDEIEEQQEPIYEEEVVEQPKPRKAKKTKPRFAIPLVEEQTRLELKKACVQSACGIVISSSELMEQSYEQLIQNIETLSIELYRIIVSKNENAQIQP